MKLYMHPVSTASRPVLLFCAENNVAVEMEVVDLMTGAHLQPPFITMNPSGQVPVLEDDGFVLTESSAILKYIAEKTGSPTYPTDLKGRARVNERMDWFNTGLYREYGYHLIYPQVFPHHNRGSEAAQMGTLEWGKKSCEKWMKVLDENIIGKNAYVCGDKISIADYFGAALVATGDLVRVDVKRFPNVDRWMQSMRGLSSWKKIHEPIEGFAASMREKEFVTFA
jgi:glutathione S-transferase